MQKALYRAYRPQTFDEVVGQEGIVKALKHQIMTGHVGHAYLFAGTRGTGKTSCAKIFARAVNCLHPHDGNPCNECANCRAILDETTMDVVEMDAASNRRIDDIRELRDTVIYPPSNLKYKVYIIDEAHMITNEAFNALLKIMEEPPEHLIFVLATTAPEKIPQTILSRVQRYEFRRIDEEAMARRIEEVAKDVGVTMTSGAAKAIALAAEGALRDGLSLLEQVMASGEPHLTEEVVARMLGTAGQTSLEMLTSEVLQSHTEGALRYAQALLREGKEPETLVREWMDFFRRLMLLKAGAEEETFAASERERLGAMIEPVELSRLVDDVDLLVDTAIMLRKTDGAETLFLSAVVRLIDHASRRDLISRIRVLEEKLSAVERWQNPEAMIREEVRRQLAAAELVPAPSGAGAAGVEAPGQTDPPLCSHPASPPDSPSVPQPPVSPAVSQPASLSGTQSDPPPDSPSVPQVASQPVSAPDPPSAVMQDFFRDPAGWFTSHADEWFRAVEDAKIVPAAMLGHYDSMEISGNDLYVHYPAGSFFERMLKEHEKALSAILSQMVGETITILIGQAPPAPRDRPPAPLSEPRSMRSKSDSFSNRPDRADATKVADSGADLANEGADPVNAGADPAPTLDQDPFAALRAVIPQDLIEEMDEPLVKREDASEPKTPH